MRHIKLYPVKILLSFLFVFCLLGTELAMFAQHVALNSSVFEKVIETEQLEEKTYATLETYFQSRSNSTGIPASVYLDVIDKDALRQGTLDSVSNAFDYLHGWSDAYQFSMDFTELEHSVTTFFSNYADENGFEKDATYQQKVTSAIQEAETEILFVTDTFKFSTIYENGWLTTAKNYISLLSKLSVLLVVASVVLFILLIICCLKQITECFYWGGLVSSIAGLLLFIPCMYLKTTDYVSGFVIKDQQIFSAVVGYLHTLTENAMLMSVITFAIGVLCLIIFSITGKRRQA